MISKTEIRQHPLYNTTKLALGSDVKAEKMIRQLIEEENKQNQSNVVQTDTNKIEIPKSMNKLQASKELRRQWDDEENFIDINRDFEGWHWQEILVATKKVLEDVFGWVDAKSSGFRNPMEMDVVVDIVNGKEVTETCYYGQVNMGPWEDANLNVGPYSLTCTVKKRYAKEVRDFYNKVDTHLREHSIYRGKSITVTERINPWGQNSLNFTIIENMPSEKIVLNDTLRNTIDLLILKKLGKSGKRSYLFTGGYGNGKTETAMQIGLEANHKGMAFFYCKSASVFQQLLAMSVNYQPCVVFLEDVDEIASGEVRDSKMNSILNTLDGVETKGKDLTVIFTTNHEKRINKALRRPGRIDIVAKFTNPDMKSKQTILKSFLKTYDKENKLNYKTLAEKVGDVPGAVIAEICKRAVDYIEAEGICTNKVVQAMIDSMKDHLELMAEPAEQTGNSNVEVTIQNVPVQTIEG